MTEIDPSYWEPPDDPDAEDAFFDAFASTVAAAAVDCPRGCGTLARCDEPEECSARRPRGERFGAGVCRTGACVEPCGPNGGCSR